MQVLVAQLSWLKIPASMNHSAREGASGQCSYLQGSGGCWNKQFSFHPQPGDHLPSCSFNMSHPRKRQKLAQASAEKSGSNENTVLASLSRSITPPLTARAQRSLPRHLDLHNESQSEVEELQIHEANREKLSHKSQERPRVIRSPIQLTRIRDLPEEKNVDTVQLRDILGDPLIRECWQFNYCFDVDFLMRQFDADVRNLVLVKIVHGSWKQDSPNRIRIDVRPSFIPGAVVVVYVLSMFRKPVLATRMSRLLWHICQNPLEHITQR